VIIETGLIEAGLVKLGLVEAIRRAIQRYFRRNEGTTDHATIPNAQPSGDVVIEFDILAPAQDDNNAISFRNDTSLNTFGIASGRDINGTSAKLRLFSSAIPVIDATSTMDVFDNIFHTVRFEYTDSTNSCRVLVDGIQGISPRTLGYNFTQNTFITLWRDVTTGDEMAGILANVKIYSAGVLVRNYPVNDNSSTLKDLVSGQDGTVVNGTSDQWALFNKQATGEWLGKNLSEILFTGVLGDDSDPEFAFPYSVTEGLKYRIKAVFENSFSAGTGQVGWSSSSGVPATSDFRKTSASAGEAIGGDYVATSSQSNALFGRANPNASYIDISVKEVLDVPIPPSALFNSSGVMTCSGTLSCTEIIPCGA
jgi:hypothetical protein